LAKDEHLRDIVQSSGSQSGRNRLLGGDVEEQGGEKNKGAVGGQNSTKGAKMLNH